VAEAQDPRITAVETGIKTFLIADVRGYTRFTSDRGDEAAARLATRFAELARETIEAAGGTLVELRGDEALAVFDSARQALRAAADLQERFVTETVADPSLPLAVGIGLDAGEAVPVDGGYRGGALNLAARLCSLAGPGEVLVSPSVAHLARKVEGLDYIERGAVRLKGLEKPVDVVAVRPEREDVARDLAFRRALDPAVTGAVETRNPYKGLRAFAEDDAADFFGREALTEHLVERLAETRFLAVVGPSGSGKSSVVRAGLVPRIREGALPGSERWSVVEMFPGAYPLEELEAALLRVADKAPASLLEQLERDELGLLRAVKQLLADDGSEFVLVVDQLEEVFTLVEDEARRTQFLALLERAITDPHARLRVVVTLRADFYDRPLLYSGFAELLRDYVEALVPLRAEEFERAIAGPAERVGARFEPGLLSQLVTDVADEPGALPLLQYALTELYERREGSTLTADAYCTIGGISGALAGRAEEIYGGLGGPAQEAARQLFLRLVTLGEGAEDTRRRVERTELVSMEVDQAALEEAIQEFGAWRLLSFDRDPRGGTPTIEVAHEALMREWGRFRRWIDSGREQVRLHRRLAAAAREWEEAGRESSYLLRGSNLAQFELLAGESAIALTELEREFVEASTAANELELARQRRQNRRLRALLAGAVGLLVLAVIAGALALVSRSNAQHEAKIALGRQIGAEAVSEPRIDLAMLLARESLNLDKSPQTKGTLLATLLRSPAAITTFTVPIGSRPCCAISVSPNGSILAIPDNTNHLRLVDTRTRETLRVFPHAGYLSPPAFTPDGSTLAFFAGKSTPVVDVVDSRTLRIRRQLKFDHRWLTKQTTNPNLTFFFTPDGRSLLYLYQLAGPAGSAAYVDRWNVASGKVTSVAVGADGAVGGELVDRGREFAVIGNSRVSFFDTKTLRLRRRVSFSQPSGTSTLVGSSALSPDGTTLAIGSDNGSVTFIDLRTGRSALGQGGHTAAVVSTVYSPSGSRFVSTSEDGSVVLWDSRTRTPIERLYGHAGRVLGVAFSSDGRTLFTSSLDGAVFEWDLGTSRRFGRPFSFPHVITDPATLSPATPGAPLLTVSSSGRLFAASASQSSVEIYSATTLRRVATVSLSPNRNVGGGAWAGSRFVLGGDRGLVQVWAVGRGKPKAGSALKGLSRQAMVRSLASAEDGRVIAAVDGWYGPPPKNSGPPEEGELAIWRGGRLVGTPLNLHAFGNGVALSADGSTAAGATDSGKLLVVDTGTGKRERTIVPNYTGGGLQAVAFSPDGTIAVGSWSGVVTLWNSRSGEEIGDATLVAPAPVAAISFSSDGATFATSGGSSGGARIWVTATRQQLGADFPGGAGQWGNVAYTPNGRYLISVFGDGSADRWPVSLGAWERHACAVAGRDFTQEEWRRFVGSRSQSRVCS
jgi:WD40 repeat protein/class 3 adenylate cyclase